MKALAEVIAASGLSHPSELRLHHFSRRIGPNHVESFEQIYRPLQAGALLTGSAGQGFAAEWARARPDSFLPDAGLHAEPPKGAVLHVE